MMESDPLGLNGQEPENDWNEKLPMSFRTDAQFEIAGFERRRALIGDWFFEADLGFIFAPRGLGKSWFAIDLAKALAVGRPFGPWKVEGEHRILFMDGEMPPDDIQRRSRSLGACSNNLIWVNHQIVFDCCAKILNLASHQLQDAVLRSCIEYRIEVLVLDNLSTLVSGVKENTSEDWELLQAWLLELRRHKISVIWIHHTGTDRTRMRGATKREDPAFWVIRLDESEHEEFYTGAKFITHFTKSRNSIGYPASYEWSYTPNGQRTEVTVRIADNYNQFIRMVELGLDTATTLAEELAVSASTISRLAKRAENEGLITIKNRKYLLCGIMK
jgi:RecA-family ATPase